MATLKPEEIYALVAQCLGNPLLAEDLAQDFTVHTEASEWIEFAAAIEAELRKRWFAEPIGQATWGLKGITQRFTEPVIATNPAYWRARAKYEWIPVYAAPQDQEPSC